MIFYTKTTSSIHQNMCITLKRLDSLCHKHNCQPSDIVYFSKDKYLEKGYKYKKGFVNLDKLFKVIKEKGLSNYALLKSCSKKATYLNKVKQSGYCEYTVLVTFAKGLDVTPDELWCPVNQDVERVTIGEQESFDF